MKLLLIMPKFFDYPEQISEELKNMGYEVDFFDDRPSTKGIVKAIIRVNKNLINGYIKRYFEYMMKSIGNKKYDIVFLISGQSLSFSEDMIKKLRENQKQAKFILYQWDSLKNFPYILKVHKYFDKIFSFDKEDCKSYDDINFLPLFYSKKYANIGNLKNKKYKYDFCFVGTAHPKKYKFINQMSKQLTAVYKNQFIYFFFPSKIVYYYRKLKNSEFKKASIDEFHFKPLKGKELDNIIADSKCILDSPQDGQLGLTMRVFEAFGANKKLITTNENIINYDFYKPENIYIYKDKFDFQSDFFKKDYIYPDKGIYKKYSLENWLKIVIGE